MGAVLQGYCQVNNQIVLTALPEWPLPSFVLAVPIVLHVRCFIKYFIMIMCAFQPQVMNTA